MKEILKKFIPTFILNWYHFTLACLGVFIYSFPSKKLIVIGVTGTSGKSTVVELIARILETNEKLSKTGHKVASLSSIKFKIGEREQENTLKMTMPGRFKIQKFLKQALNSDCKYVVLEVTSEGIRQHRHRFIDFDVAVFTNLTPEHIEAHGGFENYKQAKSELFKTTRKVHIINSDDKNAEYFLGIPADKKYKYSIKEIITPDDHLAITGCSTGTEGISFKVNNTQFNLSLLGQFNTYNALAAICVGLSQEVPLEACKGALEDINGMPGRMEVVINKPFTVVVDYAHTPTALEKVYQTANNLKPNLICVLGACGGGRDKWKRPVLGKIAAKYCKEIIITNEDPYNENPMEIIKQVVKGTNGKAEIILDRRDAIQKALQKAKQDDIIIITGKGCEPWMCVKKGRKIAWDDRRIVKEEFQKNP